MKTHSALLPAAALVGALITTVLPLASAIAGPLVPFADVDSDPANAPLDLPSLWDPDTPDSRAQHLWLTIAATTSRRDGASADYGGMVLLEIPWDRVRRPALDRGPSDASAPFVFAEKPSPRAPAAVAPSPSAAPSSAPSAPVAEPAPLAAITVPAATVQSLVTAAWKVARLDDGDQRLDRLASRSRTSALLPELRLRATRVVDESQSSAPTEYDPTRRTATGGTSLWLEARATFRLDKLLFADDEIAIEKMRQERAESRAKLAARVVDLVGQWQRAATIEADAEAKPEARRAATLSAAEAEASLDVLTGASFTKATKGLRKQEGAATSAAPVDAAAAVSR